MPTNEVIIITTTSSTVALINSIFGLNANIYGIINAAMASFVAITPVLNGLE